MPTRCASGRRATVAEPRQGITVAVDANEIPGTHELQWETVRKDVTPEGALGVANNTGLVGLTVNGQVAVRLWLHEDESGYVVVDVLDGRTNERIARSDVELYGAVPPRRGSAPPRRDKRFGKPLGGAQ